MRPDGRIFMLIAPTVALSLVVFAMSMPGDAPCDVLDARHARGELTLMGRRAHRGDAERGRGVLHDA